MNNIKHQRRTTSDGKIIDIYDNVFPQNLRHHHLDFAQNSYYKFGIGSTNAQWHRKNSFFQSTFIDNDLKNFNIFNPFFEERFKNHEVVTCWFLVSSPLSTYYFHPDSTGGLDKITFLYYVNTRWDREWGGETLFANDSGECEIAVEYKPGRVVIFDSFIEHKPSAISMAADEFRFTFSMQLRLKNSLSNNG